MIRQEKMTIPGSRHPKNTNIPMFQEQNRTKKVHIEADIEDRFKEYLGFEAAPRFLPYTIQDRYDRNCTMEERQTILLENDILRAVFLPEFGGRLYSLYHKQLERELLFKNPVIQPANLAILDAWIAGGIEWNAGQFGHAFTTCDTLFTGVLTDDDGNEFLRMYEYERCHNIFWHVDIHLPAGSETLNVYVRMVNDRDEDTSAYWWTNIAVPETEKARIYSGTDEVLYFDLEEQKFGKGQLPVIGSAPDIDASYPARFRYASEYFFQTPETEVSPWEACVYPDDFVFYERSSRSLRYRKMFCWGTHQGGQHWKDYLSEKGKGDYIEIQGGLSRTQCHGMVFPAHSEIEFVQCFGAMKTDTSRYYEKCWQEGKELLSDEVSTHISAEDTALLFDELRKYRDHTPERLLTYGSGYGALERIRREKQQERSIPEGFLFPKDSLTKEQAPWLQLLETGRYESSGEGCCPVSYMVQPEWKVMLEKSLTEKESDSSEAWLQFGIMLTEEGRYDEAAAVYERLLEKEDQFLACRNLAYIYREQENTEKALALYEKAVNLTDSPDAVLVCLEYLRLLRREKQYDKMWEAYESISAKLKADERIYLEGVFAALYTDRLSLVEPAFHREYSNIRESNTDLSFVWNEYHRRKYPEITDTERRYPVPYELDFRTK